MEKPPFEEEIEKELYKYKPSERLGKVKKIWGIRKKKPVEEERWEEKLFDEEESFFEKFEKINIYKIFYISSFLFLASLVIFGFIYYYRALYLGNIRINILGPQEVSSLFDYEYLLKIENNSKYQLVNTNLEIQLDDGVYFVDDMDARSKKFEIGDLSPRSFHEIKFPVFFIGKAGEVTKIKVILNYYTEKINQLFENKNEAKIVIEKEPVSLNVFAPSKVFLNEPFNIYIKTSNNTDKTFDLNLELISQGALEVLSLSPPSTEHLKWHSLSLSSGYPLEINIYGKFVKPQKNVLIYLNPYISYRNKLFSLESLPLSIEILETPLVLEIKSNPEESIIKPGTHLYYEIKFVNKSSVQINNTKIKVKLEGPFNFESIQTSGYFDPFENSIIWDARNKPILYKIPIGHSDSVGFTINVISQYPVGAKNLELKVIAVLETETIPPEVQILSKTLTVETQNVKQVLGTLSVSSKLSYSGGQFTNTGPFPLQKGRSTTLTWKIQLMSFAEDFQNVTIKTKIPIGVKLTGLFGGEFIPNNLHYNKETGDFIYKIDELPAGYGSLYPPYEILIQIEVTPPLYGHIENFLVIHPLEVTAESKFTLQSFHIRTDALVPRDIEFSL